MGLLWCWEKEEEGEGAKREKRGGRFSRIAVGWGEGSGQGWEDGGCGSFGFFFSLSGNGGFSFFNSVLFFSFFLFLSFSFLVILLDSVSLLSIFLLFHGRIVERVKDIGWPEVDPRFKKDCGKGGKIFVFFFYSILLRFLYPFFSQSQLFSDITQLGIKSGILALRQFFNTTNSLHPNLFYLTYLGR